MDYDEFDYISHYGVLGMKWGVRKKRASSSSGRTSSKKKTTLFSSVKKRQAAKKRAKAVQKREDDRLAKNLSNDRKNIKSMTDAELNKYVARLQKEKQARDLKYDSLSTGKKIIKKAATDSATKILSTAGYQIGIYLIGKPVNKTFGDEVITSGNKKKKKKDDDD